MNIKKLIKIKKMSITMIKYFYYCLYCKIKKIKNDDVWLISERGYEAKDNGFAFYNYLKAKHPQIKVKYVISKESKDIKKFNNKEDLVDYMSKEHFILYITSKYLISTHICGYSPDKELFFRLKKWRIIKERNFTVSLKHGIAFNDIMKIFNINIMPDLMTIGAKIEYDYILNNYKSLSKNIKYTGLARYDTLINNPQNIILIMPTFRKWLNYEKNFITTEYYKKYNSLINNEELNKFAKENGYKIIFYPHFEIQKYLNLFEKKYEVLELASIDYYDVQQLLKISKILITDYSSVFLDFAYMEKPVIYYHFDEEEFYKKHYSKGYFNYETMGFGVVAHKEEEINEAINKSFNNNFQIEPYIKERLKCFFEYNDKNNCERIYNEIIKR